MKHHALVDLEEYAEARSDHWFFEVLEARGSDVIVQVTYIARGANLADIRSALIRAVGEDRFTLLEGVNQRLCECPTSYCTCDDEIVRNAIRSMRVAILGEEQELA